MDALKNQTMEAVGKDRVHCNCCSHTFKKQCLTQVITTHAKGARHQERKALYDQGKVEREPLVRELMKWVERGDIARTAVDKEVRIYYFHVPLPHIVLEYKCLVPNGSLTHSLSPRPPHALAPLTDPQKRRNLSSRYDQVVSWSRICYLSPGHDASIVGAAL
jgi:hypothetical protein